MLGGNIFYNASAFKLKLNKMENSVPELHWPLFKSSEALGSSTWLVAAVLDDAGRAEWSVS